MRASGQCRTRARQFIEQVTAPVSDLAQTEERHLVDALQEHLAHQGQTKRKPDFDAARTTTPATTTEKNGHAR